MLLLCWCWSLYLLLNSGTFQSIGTWLRLPKKQSSWWWICRYLIFSELNHVVSIWWSLGFIIKCWWHLINVSIGSLNLTIFLFLWSSDLSRLITLLIILSNWGQGLARTHLIQSIQLVKQLGKKIIPIAATLHLKICPGFLCSKWWAFLLNF